jgi:RNA polymerase sigma factor (sigma-70 family)
MGDTTARDLSDREADGLPGSAGVLRDSGSESPWARPADFPPALEGRGRFVETYARLVYAAIERTLRKLGVTRDADLAEDLFAGVFVAMFDNEARRLRQWHGRCSLETWLTLIASSVVRDHLRSERRFEARIDRTVRDLEGMGQHDVAYAFETTHDRDFKMERLRAALGELAETDRRLIEALYLAKRTPTEVARELGLTMGALYTRKSRALERLRVGLVRHDEDR